MILYSNFNRRKENILFFQIYASSWQGFELYPNIEDFLNNVQDLADPYQRKPLYRAFKKHVDEISQNYYITPDQVRTVRTVKSFAISKQKRLIDYFLETMPLKEDESVFTFL